MNRDEKWQNLVAAVAKAEGPDGANLQAIAAALQEPLPKRTLQYRLKQAVELGYLRKTGKQRGMRYFSDASSNSADSTAEDASPFSSHVASVLAQIRKPILQREPVPYEYGFLDIYQPNKTAYLNVKERQHLETLCHNDVAEPAGTFARNILNRLLIDLSWNSSRLEGNTYSMLETRRLIQFGAEAEGKAFIDAQMILNHKDAIEFLVDGAEDIDFNRFTILNLHGLLSNNLLATPDASGRLRTIDVGIGKSVYQPLAAPQLIEAYFDHFLEKAQRIKNPFEQALFALVQLPYLQAFDDVNKCVSRLAANIPFIKHNLIPLSFVDLPKDSYTEAVLAVYELNKIEPLKEIFIWAYERSAAYYKVVRQTLGEPDALRLHYRDELKELVTSVVTGRLDRKAALRHINQWTQTHIPEQDKAEFQDRVEQELLSLHPGNMARYRIKPSQFNAWQKVWLV